MTNEKNNCRDEFAKYRHMVKADLRSVLHFLHGKTPRKQIINYIYEYLYEETRKTIHRRS